MGTYSSQGWVILNSQGWVILLVKGGSFLFSRVGHLALVFHLLVAVKVYSE